MIYHFYGKDWWVIPCHTASLACPCLNQQTPDSRQGSKQFWQLSKSILSITNSSKWLSLINGCKYSVSQLYSFSSLELRLGNRSLLGRWAKGARRWQGDFSEGGFVVPEPLPGNLLGTSTAKTLQSKWGALIPFPPPRTSIQKQFFAWALLLHDPDWQLQGLSSGPLCTLAPWSVELHNLYFLPRIYPASHKTLVTHCGKQPFFHSGLAKENKTKHQTLQQYDGDGNDWRFVGWRADSKLFHSWDLGTHLFLYH